jgi:Ca2+-transporting ATPase
MTGDGAWHVLDVETAAGALGVNPAVGLSGAEAVARLERHGPNRLPVAATRSPWLLLLDQFRNFLIVVLMCAAVVAGLIGDVKDAVAIAVVLVFNALLGFVQEYRAEQSLAALRRMLVAHARVRRDGTTTEVSAEVLVPGDVVLLEAGDRVPADGRLIVARGAELDESSLTGESNSVGKQTEPLASVATPLADRSNLAFMNTVVTRGRVELLVTATGSATEVGALAGMLERAESGPTPLQLQLDVLGKRLALVAAGAVLVYFALGLVRGEALDALVPSAIALAVAAIPEGLPAVVTVTLAVGTYQMARRGAIVKRLASVETLGCTSVICSDKTGTLTVNQMTVRRVWAAGYRYTVTGEGYRPDGAVVAERGLGDQESLDRLLRAAVLCNDSDLREGALLGDPTEGALLTLAEKRGLDVAMTREAFPRAAEIPFDPAVKYMATLHRDRAGARVLAKGAPEVVLARCHRRALPGGDDFLDEDARAEVEAEMSAMAEGGLRVLAFAERVIDEAPAGSTALGEHLGGLTFLGVVGELDPSRPEAREAVRRCHRAGIDVKMITGDHAATAASIARDLGIEGDVITGAELDEISEAELAARIARIAVFARVAPEHKVAIVRALQAKGHVVAMTGDGVNDAPALKTADIGVAMGVTGTEVSKEAAAMVLTDDNFATIERAVEQGRTIYDNIVKFVRFQLSTNMGAILSLVGAQVVGLPAPFAAIQILWVNLIMDGPPAMALGVDPPDPGVMTQPPRDPRARILTLERFGRLLALGLLMAIGTLGVLGLALDVTTEARALTLAFTTFVFFQVFNAFNARSERRSALRRESLRNARLWVALAAVVALQVMIVEVGAFQGLFETESLTAAGWVVAIGVGSSILWIEELHKLVRRVASARRRRTTGAPRAESGIVG